MTSIKPSSTPAAMGSPSSPAVPDPDPFLWSYAYDGPIAKVDDRNCALCNAASSGKCQHGSEVCPLPRGACTTAWAAKVGYCHNHHGLADSLAAHASEHALDAASLASFESVKKGVLDAVSALPKDTKRILVKLVAQQNLELTIQTLKIDITSFR